MGSLVWLCCLSLYSFVSGYSYFRRHIPNGLTVLIPCSNRSWTAVGHLDYVHPSLNNLNPFGKRFKEFGYRWNRILCEEDSDGDGVSNGKELGDERCQFPSGPPLSKNATSHPGIDDAMYCKQQIQQRPATTVGDKPATSGKSEKKPQ